MKLILAFIALLFLAHTGSNEDIDFVISNSKIINTEDGSIKEGHDILIKGNIIGAIVPHRKSYDRSVKIIDGNNLFTIPGLWDMHVHAIWSGWFDVCNPLMVAYGVTGFRDTWGELKLADTIRRKMAAGEIPFQRFILSGNLIDGSRPIWPTSQVADSPSEGTRLVDSLYKAGADFIKVYSRLKPEVFFAIAKRCKELNMKFAGHVPEKVKLVDAANAGMYSMEHLTGVTEAFSDIEDSIFALINKTDYTGDPKTFGPLMMERLNLLVKSKIVPEKAAKIIDAFKKNHTWIVPTMLAKRGISFMDVMSKEKDERLNYLPEMISFGWKPENDFRVKSRTPQQWLDVKTLYQSGVAQLTLLNKSNIQFLAGTDFPNPYCFPGSGIHDEFELMTGAGFTPLQALQAATLNAAKYLGKTDSLGTIAPNKYADILLLAENPLANISNSRKIEALFVNGRFYNKRDLEALKQKAKEISVKVNEANK
jgi:hypothetical protein